MLRLSFVCSVCVHVVLLGVMSVVLAHTAQQPSEEQSIHVRLQTQAAAAPPVPFRPADPAQSQLPVVTSPPMVSPRQSAPTKQRAVKENPKPVRTMPRPLNTRVQQPEPERRTPPAPKDVVMVAQTFPTPLPTPSPLPTPLPVPTAIPEPTPISTPTPAPRATPQPTPMPNTPVPTATITPQPALTPRPAATAIVQGDQQTESPADVSLTSQVAQRTDNDIAQPQEVVPEPPQTLSAEQQQTLLKAYVQHIVADIQEVKTYPRNARRKGWEGTVMIQVHILATGTLKEIAIAQTSGYTLLDNAALEAIQEILPFPEFPDGISMPALIVNIPIQFTLK